MISHAQVEPGGGRCYVAKITIRSSRPYVSFLPRMKIISTQSSQKKPLISVSNHFSHPPSGWDSLPVDIIREIIKHVHAFNSDECEKTFMKRRRRLIPVSQDKHGRRIVYAHRKQPILNSFQSLAVTNQELYALCRPLLWKASL